MMPGKHAVAEQINELAPHVRGGFVCVVDIPSQFCVIGHTQPTLIPLEAIGVNLLEEVEMAVEEITDEESFYRTVGSIVMDWDKPYLKYRIRDDAEHNRRDAKREVEDLDREIRKDFRNLQKDRVVTSGHTTGDRQWHR